MGATGDVTGWLLVAAVAGLFGWYFIHVALRIRNAKNVISALPGALERSFDGSVPVWLRLVRVVMIMVICAGAAWIMVRKLGI